MQNGELRYFSTFSGIGGFELGIERAFHNRPDLWDGVEELQGDKSHAQEQSVRPTCIGYSEIDKYAVQIYQRHFPNHTNYGDITKIKPEDLPNFDLFVGGFPCQAFSVAGLRRGFEDTRGTLFFEIARICKVKQPRLLLLENVKGLLSHDQGRTFRTIIATLDELGYDLQWQVLNSKNHGVPQNRERIFIVGHLRGTPRPEVFPFGENGGEVDELSRHVSNTLTRRYEGAQAVGTYIGEGQLNAQEDQPPFITDPQGRKDKQDKPSAISPTLRAQTHGNQPVVNLIRRLTPIECERLQGFPDGWTELGHTIQRIGDGVYQDVVQETFISDTQRYKCLGNAVTVNVIEVIVARLV